MDRRGGKLERKNAELIDLKMAKTYFSHVCIHTRVLYLKMWVNSRFKNLKLQMYK